MFTRNVLKRAMRQRFAITLRDDEGVFSGHLTEFDDRVLVLEGCETIPATPGETPAKIAGRVFVERDRIAYAQALT
ncbi:hypothetical protein E2F47_23580 [Mycobacterium eburneum]|nr:hypothetical protein [Mycobacterium eburneum]TDH48501.1 hypothetical protein E2F47_23580 [Mycobacterium eburneum]